MALLHFSNGIEQNKANRFAALNYAKAIVDLQTFLSQTNNC